MTADVSDTSHRRDGSIVKLRLDSDFDAFVREDGVRTTLKALATALAIPTTDIALIDLRSGCVILVIELPDEAAERLVDLNSLPDDDPLKLLVQTLRVSKITAGDAVEAPELLKARSMPFEPDLSWLHLSDLHITPDYSDEISDTAADLNRLLDDLPTQLGEVKLAPDAIFFTGDVSQSGTEDEYEVAAQFFASLLQVMPEASRLAPLFIVPGNHDITWSAIEPDLELELRSKLNPNADATQTLEDYADYIAARQKNFRTFMDKLRGDLTIPPLDGFSYTSSFNVASRNIRIGVAGFNSSWLSTRKDLYANKGIPDAETLADLDLQHLRLGTRQLRVAGVSADVKQANIRIALMHHEPLSQWFADADREAQRQALSTYHFVLRGHQHEACARVGSPKFAGSDDFVELAPGALRTKPHWYQGFMTTELDLSSGMMRLRAWTVSARGRRWLPDPEFGKNGSEFRSLPEQLTDPASRSATRTGALASRP